MGLNNGNVKVTSNRARNRLLAPLVAFVAITAIASEAAADDIWTTLGLTGGPNLVALVKVLSEGEIVFPAAATDWSAVQVKSGPKAQFAARCKRDGYRCMKLVGATTVVFDSKNSQEEGEIEANLTAVAYAKDAAKNRSAVVKALQSACAAKQTTISLPVAVRLFCKKVKTALGASVYEVASSEMPATYKLTCN